MLKLKQQHESFLSGSLRVERFPARLTMSGEMKGWGVGNPLGQQPCITSSPPTQSARKMVGVKGDRVVYDSSDHLDFKDISFGARGLKAGRLGVEENIYESLCDGSEGNKEGSLSPPPKITPISGQLNNVRRFIVILFIS